MIKRGARAAHYHVFFVCIILLCTTWDPRFHLPNYMVIIKRIPTDTLGPTPTQIKRIVNLNSPRDCDDREKLDQDTYLQLGWYKKFSYVAGQRPG